MSYADPTGTLDSCSGTQNEQKSTQNTVIEVGGPQITSIYMAVYFRVLHFGGIFFLFCQLLNITCVNNQKHDFWVINFDPLIFTNIPSRFVPKIPRHTPVHSACRRTICGGRDLCIISESGIRILTRYLELEDENGDQRRLSTISAKATVDAIHAPGVRVREGERRDATAHGAKARFCGQ